MATINKRVWNATTETGKQCKQVRWDAQVYLGRDATGRVRFVTKTFQRSGDAEQWARDQEVQRVQGGLGPPTRDTFATYLRHWLDVKAGEIRPRTLSDYRDVLFRWILSRAPNDPVRRPEPPKDSPQLGTVRMDKLNAKGLEVLYNWMAAHGKSAGTIRSLHKILSQALKAAARKGSIPRNWAEVADVPKAQERGADAERGPSIRALTKEQAVAFLAAARADRYSALWHVLLLGGLRPGEAFGLKWSDVEFEERRIHVVRSLSRVKGIKGWQLTLPKTKNGRRSVPLPPVAMWELRGWKKKQAEERLALGPEWQDHGFVFTTHCGAPLEGSNVHGSSFRWIMAKAGLGEWGPEPAKPRSGPTKRRPFKPAFRVYDLRHSCATLLLLAGESVKVVSERLGHASVVLTLDTYSHVLPTMQEQAAARLEQMFGTA
ncbi:MAG: site-specific integrase [Chloroflexi bacterium]|nr:site-specific integrase [Chloroflexota bacterium]